MDHKVLEESEGEFDQGRVRELLSGICKEHDVEIIKGPVSKDHVHLFVSAPNHFAMSKLVQYLKGKSSYKIIVRKQTVVTGVLGMAFVGTWLFCSYVG